jgi:hypothetical protein
MVAALIERWRHVCGNDGILRLRIIVFSAVRSLVSFDGEVGSNL